MLFVWPHSIGSRNARPRKDSWHLWQSLAFAQMPWDCTQWQAQRSIGHNKPWEVQTNAFQSLASVKIVGCAINPQTHCKSFRSLQDPLHVQQMFFATLAKSWSLKEKVSALLQKKHPWALWMKEWNVFDFFFFFFFFVLSRVPKWNFCQKIRKQWP